MHHLGILWPYLQTLAKPERPAADKHSSLLRTFINYNRTKFYNIETWPAESLCRVRVLSNGLTSKGDIITLKRPGTVFPTLHFHRNL